MVEVLVIVVVLLICDVWECFVDKCEEVDVFYCCFVIEVNLL